MKIKLISVMALSATVTGALISTMAQAGTSSLDLTVNSNVTMGTCTASLLNDNGSSTSTIAFGDVYISEIGAKSKVKTFKLRFTDCAGIPQQKALVTLTPRGTGCSGSSAAFANSSTAASKANNTAVEIWTTKTPEGSSSVQMQCSNANTQEVNIASASGSQYVDYDLSARMVIAPGQVLSSVSAGDFYSPATFTISYQ
ncbi:fimbrial protein [Salmonella enterica subsp. enterica serovar Kotte]|nr:fimbrial protein [Salmonella enterica subsp. enterica serovar Kotte]